MAIDDKHDLGPQKNGDLPVHTASFCNNQRLKRPDGLPFALGYALQESVPRASAWESEAPWEMMGKWPFIVSFPFSH
jgi:hypothetical protein